jgi:hypothetical protein
MTTDRDWDARSSDLPPLIAVPEDRSAARGGGGSSAVRGSEISVLFGGFLHRLMRAEEPAHVLHRLSKVRRRSAG